MNWLRENRRVVASAAAFVVGLAGICVLIGWQFRIPSLKGEFLGSFVAPNTALLFILVAIAVVASNSGHSKLNPLAHALGAIVLVFATLVLLEHLLHVDFGFDGILFSHRSSDWYVPTRFGRFSFTTSLGFICTGLSLLTLRSKWKVPVSDIFAGAIALICYLSFLGFVFNAAVLFGRITAIATVSMFAVVLVALWFSSSHGVFVDLITSEFAGGIVARRFTGSILLILPILGLLFIKARERDLLSRELGVALLVAASASIITALALQTAFLLNEVDRRRAQAESVLIRTEKLAATGRMAATIAHEINNPLSAVTNLIYLSRRPEVDAPTRDSFLASAQHELNRVAMIVKKTLGFYRESSAPDLVEVAELVREVLDLYKSRIESRSITIEERIEPKVSVLASGGELRQVLSNLISNAIDACPSSQGRIHIAIERLAGRVRVEISDNGHGVTEENRAKIFEAFFTTKKDVGTGLGLWISKQLVEKNGGEISLVPTSAPGTTFVLSFPAQHSAARSTTES